MINPNILIPYSPMADTNCLPLKKILKSFLVFFTLTRTSHFLAPTLILLLLIRILKSATTLWFFVACAMNIYIYEKLVCLNNFICNKVFLFLLIKGKN